jgi:hypothetical protein
VSSLYHTILLPFVLISDFFIFILRNKIISLVFHPPNLKDQVTIIIPSQWQGSTVIPPDMGYPFRRLL